MFVIVLSHSMSCRCYDALIKPWFKSAPQPTLLKNTKYDHSSSCSIFLIFHICIYLITYGMSFFSHPLNVLFLINHRPLTWNYETLPTKQNGIFVIDTTNLFWHISTSITVENHNTCWYIPSNKRKHPSSLWQKLLNLNHCPAKVQFWNCCNN